MNDLIFIGISIVMVELAVIFMLYVNRKSQSQPQSQPQSARQTMATMAAAQSPVPSPYPDASQQFRAVTPSANMPPAAFEPDDDDGEITPERMAAWAVEEDDDAVVLRPSQCANLFDVLGVARDATIEQIRTGYRDQCRIWHPDHNTDAGAADEFAEVAMAYKILLTQRAKYVAGLQIEEENQ